MRFPKTFPRIILILLNLGPVLLNLVPVITSVPGNQAVSLCQNSGQTVPNSANPVPYPVLPLQLSDELHQEDLRIMPVLVHISGPETEAVSVGGHLSRLKSNRR